MIVYYTTDIDGDQLTLTGDDHRHCAKATRRKPGDTIHITDGQGTLYTAEITDILRDLTLATLKTTTPTLPLPYELHIAIAPTKNQSRLEWFVEKSIEIGIHHIHLLDTARGEKAKVKLDRLQRIAIAAMKQSLNVYLPTIHPLCTLTELMDRTAELDLRCVAHCVDPEDHLRHLLSPTPQRILVAIGPEGDFTEEEINEMSGQQFQEVNLGRSRLRTETAGVVATSIVHNFIVS